MATFIAYTPFNAYAFPFAPGETTFTIATSTHIQETWGSSEANYYGSGFAFGYDPISDSYYVAGGTLTGGDYRLSGVMQFEVTGLNHSVSTVYSYIVAQDGVGLLTYALNGADLFVGSSGNDNAFGGDGNDSFAGSPGDDTAAGGNGNDTLVGGAGDDLGMGQAGDDLLYGGDGNDTGRGAGGNDDIRGQAGDDVLYGGAGNDTLRGAGGNDVNRGAGGDDVLYGGAFNDTLFGGAGNDVLRGAGGDDNNQGGVGDDMLYGGAGNDALYGDDDGDTLLGALGNDTLTGGLGADQFVFNSALDAAANVDTLLDFEAGVDQFLLDPAVFAALSAGALAAGSFHGGTTAADTNDFILYDAGTGDIFYDADGSGTGAAPVLFAQVTSSLALTAADFLAGV
ncbi:MAG: hypothetical protein HYU77_18170 [Betaproteobacteria bacterium]|nr:hypothetical protein [Betaproteobacteria bacterium]